MKEHRRFIILGDTDKVDFLYYTQFFCIAHKLNGFAKNGKVGRIHVEAEGEKEELEALERYYLTGPLKKYIKDVKVEPGEVKGFTGFDLKKDPEKGYCLSGLKQFFTGNG